MPRPRFPCLTGETGPRHILKMGFWAL
jgi:hypothetical protein